MIRRTLATTQAATYSIDIPNPSFEGMPTPAGTGFFVSPDGWFVTAAHVVLRSGALATEIENTWLMKESRPGKFSSGMCQVVSVDHVDPDLDFALLRVDWDANSSKTHLKGLSGFPHLTVSSRFLDEAEPVYAFGYPLPDARLLSSSPQAVVGHVGHAPRTTSAIVASTMDRSRVVSSPSDVRLYTLDKALNYGNSGGPIVAAETGRVHAFCSRFQPVEVPQPHMLDADGKPMRVIVPSLYGVVVALGNERIIAELNRRGIRITND